MRNAFNIFFLCLTLVAFPLPACANAVIGQVAPSLTSTKLDGTTFNLSDLKGEVVIIHFWATWCPACREEMPILDTIYQNYHTSGLEVLGLSTDRPRDRGTVETTMKLFHFPAAMISDTSVNDFGVPHVMPVTYIIDRKGIVQGILKPDETSYTEQTLKAIIEPLLSMQK